MNFNEYADKYLSALTPEGRQLVQMGWNGHAEFGDQAACAQSGQGVDLCHCVGPGNGCDCDRCDPQPAQQGSVPEHLMARIKNLLIALGHQVVVLDEGEPPYDVGEWGIKEAQELYDPLSTTSLSEGDVSLWDYPTAPDFKRPQPPQEGE